MTYEEFAAEWIFSRVDFGDLSALNPQLLAELDERCALAAFILRGFGEGGDVGVRLEELPDLSLIHI